MYVAQLLRGYLKTHGSVASLLLHLIVVSYCQLSHQQSESLSLSNTEPFYIDLHHRFGSEGDFTTRGSILVKPKTDYRPAQASFVQLNELTDNEVRLLKEASEKDDTYYLKAAYRKKKTGKNDEPSKVTQTIIKSCSLRTSNLSDFVTINLSPLNEFLSVNLYTADPECSGPTSEDLSTRFNTTLRVESASPGPQPDTTTYIKRLEEERQSKLKEGKEDNRSFLAKYWIYIVPAVIVLMMLGGPEQGAR